MKMFATLARLLGMGKTEKIETHQMAPAQSERSVLRRFWQPIEVSTHEPFTAPKAIAKAYRKNQRRMHRIELCRPS